ncbi:LPS export ABC transporter periplasmic protein LptC [Lutibacter citreus]|uniref:LPS export ABC transporter periplasmic protein LptC n=1 Tax=Lutibacter citreus TaxID=2138210 RepID=UPI000DBE1F31|nr:LPS export ABC transporter periplasmic protein LptC [Lutibacter citreus]
MTKSIVHNVRNIVIVFSIAMFFSCTNSAKEVRDFLADKNLPIGVANNIYLKHTDSGRVDVKMKAPIMLDFRNRANHPYSEFPEGVFITTIEKNGDSTTIKGDYAKSYDKTEVSEIRDNVVIINHAKKNKLETSEIYWDQKSKYFFTEKRFVFYTESDTIYGTGFEASQDLSLWWVKNQSGIIQLKE